MNTEITTKDDSGIVADTEVASAALLTTVPEAVPVITRDRAATARGLRELADFIEQHPDIPTPYLGTLNAFVNTREQIASLARLTTWEKSYNDDWFSLRRNFAGDVTLDINIEREQVCRRVVTGQRIEPARPERTVDVVEWICDEPLLTPDGAR